MRLLLVLAAGLALAACGEAARPATQPRVKLQLTGPDDGRSLRAASVQVTGTVTPGGADVTVAGASAEVDGGTFTADVAQRPGGNVIDVTATAQGRRPAVAAIRVMRDMRVPVPSLAGHDKDEAFAQLDGLGLKPVEERGGSWIDRLLPGASTVCGTDPAAGTLVPPHAKVTVVVARSC